jgi:hypothetical protein
MNVILIVGPLFTAAAGPGHAVLFHGLDGSAGPPAEIFSIAETPPPAGRQVIGVMGAPVFLGLAPPASNIKVVRLFPVPDDFSMSHGFRTKDSWFVSAGDLRRVELIPPDGFAGMLQLRLQYHRDDPSAAVIDEALSVELRDLRQEQQSVAAIEEPKPARPPVRRVPLAEEQSSLDQAKVLIAAGDIAAARLLYEDLALRGSSRGARALAETYDPTYLERMFIRGLQPNLEMARQWYELAAELGDRESSARLTLLGR